MQGAQGGTRTGPLRRAAGSGAGIPNVKLVSCSEWQTVPHPEGPKSTPAREGALRSPSPRAAVEAQGERNAGVSFCRSCPRASAGPPSSSLQEKRQIGPLWGKAAFQASLVC